MVAQRTFHAVDLEAGNTVARSAQCAGFGSPVAPYTRMPPGRALQSMFVLTESDAMGTAWVATGVLR